MPKQALLCAFVLLVSQAAQAQYRTHTIYLSGKVVLEGGGVPSDLVQIERVCGAQTFPGGFTDSKGKFTIRVGADIGAQLQDADNAGTDFRGRSIRDPLTSGGLTGRTEGMSVVRNAGTVDMFGCDLRARLAGYRSDTIALGRRSVLGLRSSSASAAGSSHFFGCLVKSGSSGSPPTANGANSLPNHPATKRFCGGGPGRVIPGTAR